MGQKRPVLFRGRHFQDVIIILCVRWYLRYSLYLSVSSVSLAAPPVLLPIETAAPAIVAASRTAGVLVIYLTGLGVTDTPLQEGLAAPATTLLRTLVQPSVSVGGHAATVFFSGLTPGLVGLYQINALLPGVRIMA